MSNFVVTKRKNYFLTRLQPRYVQIQSLNHKLLQKGYGISIGDVTMPSMAFQDDIVQINTSQEHAQQCISATEAFQDKKCMKFNAGKT